MSFTRRCIVLQSVSLAGFAFWPSLAHANIGIPFTFLIMSVYWMILVTVVAIEAVIIFRRLQLTGLRAAGISVLVNVATALLGTILFPVVELALGEAGFDMYDAWTSTILLLVVLVPSYMLSVWIEASIAMRFIRYKTFKEVIRVFYIANIYSYLVLAGLIIVGDPVSG